MPQRIIDLERKMP